MLDKELAFFEYNSKNDKGFEILNQLALVGKSKQTQQETC